MNSDIWIIKSDKDIKYVTWQEDRTFWLMCLLLYNNWMSIMLWHDNRSCPWQEYGTFRLMCPLLYNNWMSIMLWHDNRSCPWQEDGTFRLMCLLPCITITCPGQEYVTLKVMARRYLECPEQEDGTFLDIFCLWNDICNFMTWIWHVVRYGMKMRMSPGQVDGKFWYVSLGDRAFY